MIFKKLFIIIEKYTSTKAISVLFLLSHMVLFLMMSFTFPKINAKLGTQAFDLKSFGYSHLEATTMLQNLDQATIDLYLFPQLFLLDILYPFLLALFLSTLIIRLTKLVKMKNHHVYSNLFILPFLAMIFDYTENILISIMITNKTNILPEVIKFANVFTIAKGLLTTLSWLIILVLLFAWARMKLKNKKAILE